MKRLRIQFGLVAAGIALMMWSGCTSMYYVAAPVRGDDLYGMHNRTAIAQAEAREREQARIAAEAAARARYQRDSIMAALGIGSSYSDSYSANPYDAILADSYEDAYARRLRGFNSPSYRMPSSYYNFRYSDASFYASAYDPAFYNVVVMGDEVWVEPKYISSMFGSWGRPSIHVGLGWSSPYYNSWYWGWNQPYWSAWDYWGPYYGWGGYYSGYYSGYWGGYGGGYWGHYNHYPWHGGGSYWGGGYRPNVSTRPNYPTYGSSSGSKSNSPTYGRPSGAAVPSSGGSSSSGNYGTAPRSRNSSSSSSSSSSGGRSSNDNSGSNSSGSSYSRSSSSSSSGSSSYGGGGSYSSPSSGGGGRSSGGSSGAVGGGSSRR